MIGFKIHFHFAPFRLGLRTWRMGATYRLHRNGLWRGIGIS